jgi:4'-phosphopantetheinyl transferase
MTNLRCARLPEDCEALYQELYRRAAPDRKRRADRYLRREDGLRCLAAGELLRDTVERVLGITEFEVVQDPGGKPRIKGYDLFHYNLSHSGNRVVIAWGDSPVGVDVQQMRMDPGREELAKRFFTQQEQTYIFDSPDHRSERFFRVWTGKESYLKYLGTGLRKSLNSFSIFSPEVSPMLKSWYLSGDYCVSLCTTDPDCILELEDQFFSIKE